MFKYSFILFVAIFYLQSAYSMSFFSSSNQGIGLRQYTISARALGMGGTGIATPDRLALNAFNSATWTKIKNTRFSILMNYDVNTIQLPAQEFTTSTGTFGGIQLAIPIQREKWVFGFSLTPYSEVDFSFQQKITSPVITYDQNIFFRGSISRAQFSLAWAVHRRLSFSASYHYYFGTLKDRFRNIFNNPEYFDIDQETEYEFRGPGFGLGAHFQAFDSLYIGGFVDFKPNLTLTKIIFLPISRENRETETEASLPLNWGLGASYHFADQYLFSADIAYQKWSEGFDIAGLKNDKLDDWYRTGIGFEHSHSEGRGRKIWNKIDLRTGFSVAKLGYKFNDYPVKEYSVHVGLGVPFFNQMARMDIAVEGGKRGELSRTKAQENFYRFTISISGGELWFQKFR